MGNKVGNAMRGRLVASFLVQRKDSGVHTERGGESRKSSEYREGHHLAGKEQSVSGYWFKNTLKRGQGRKLGELARIQATWKSGMNRVRKRGREDLGRIVV